MKRSNEVKRWIYLMECMLVKCNLDLYYRLDLEEMSGAINFMRGRTKAGRNKRLAELIAQLRDIARNRNGV